MAILDDHIEPGERLIWRTKALRREALRSAVLCGGLVTAAAACAIWLDTDFPYLGVVVLAVIMFAHWGRRPVEVWITARRILLLSGVWSPRISTINRADVVGAELYDCDDTLVLHGVDGELCRAAVLETPDQLLDELRLSVSFWRGRSESHLPNFTFVAFLFAMFGAAFFAIAGFIGLFVAGWVDDLHAALTDILPLAELWHRALAATAVVLAMAPGMFFGLAAAAVLRRIMLTADEMADFRRVVRFPERRGCDSRSPLYATGAYRLYRGVRLALDRLFYGRPPERGLIEPDVVAPGNLNQVGD